MVFEYVSGLDAFSRTSLNAMPNKLVDTFDILNLYGKDFSPWIALELETLLPLKIFRN